MTVKWKEIILIVILVSAITALHYLTMSANAPLHEFYRELYFIPIIFAGLMGGKIYGLTTSIIISLLFLPHVIHTMGTTLSTFLINMFEIALFNLAGMLSGIYKEAKQGLMVTMNAPYHSPEVRKNFLLFIDGTPACLYAANYFAQVFGKVQGIGVTLLWIFKGQDTDFFETLEELQKVDKEAYLKGEGILNQAKEIIVQGGVHEGDISIKKAIADKKTGLSDKLMEELKNGGYDTIVLAKRPKTKSQEFIFGSATVKMVRDAAVHVLAVKVPDNAVAGETNG